MKKLSGLNERVAALTKFDTLDDKGQPSKPPTFKEVALNSISLHRPKQGTDVDPTERLKITKLGMIFLSSTDKVEMEDDYFTVFKKVISESRGYTEFVLGQWQQRIADIELKDMSDQEKKDKK